MTLRVSDDYYQHCEAFPIYGTGQGNTNLPTIWLIISFTLFNIHKELSNGGTFSDTIQEVETNDFYNENTTPEELFSLVQEDAQFFHDGTPVMQSTRPGPPLVVKQSNNKAFTEIQYKNPYTSH
eukprot:10249420-Ditylum_brightwellii.AAC.1